MSRPKRTCPNPAGVFAAASVTRAHPSRPSANVVDKSSSSSGVAQTVRRPRALTFAAASYIHIPVTVDDGCHCRCSPLPWTSHASMVVTLTKWRLPRRTCVRAAPSLTSHGGPVFVHFAASHYGALATRPPRPCRSQRSRNWTGRRECNSSPR